MSCDCHTKCPEQVVLCGQKTEPLSGAGGVPKTRGGGTAQGECRGNW